MYKYTYVIYIYTEIYLNIYIPKPSNGVKFQPQSQSLVVFCGSNFRPKIQVFMNTVDGSEILRSPVEVGSFSHYLQGFSTIQTVVALGFRTNHQRRINTRSYKVGPYQL